MAAMTNVRIIRLKDLKQKIGLGSSAIYDRLDKNSPRFDPTFPAPIKLGQKATSAGWIESEVDAWLTAQIEASRGTAA